MLLMIEINSEQPIYQQIRDQIVAGIAGGQLPPGSSLPSIRQLAADFSINLHTVNKAYDLLEREGFIQLKRKTGAIIQVKPSLAASWVERQRTLLAEAYAKNVSSEEILEQCKKILAEFAAQRTLHRNSFNGGEQ
ncbi:GntR family transcriptional regulator [Dictyobacter arantiisoli]|uniref:GntR family transcriptional regulator n=1 Tax=Dictyobacter arantiisoli TaxID=2014874 RepID=A0A5A5TJS7_9CHLR|nr:GntR family transcriptional regulator [Dictyobacter arantiisoli]GCF11279.1 GntR family transcriptional regulator [Dictyobacter arantiisoli]